MEENFVSLLDVQCIFNDILPCTIKFIKRAQQKLAQKFSYCLRHVCAFDFDVFFLYFFLFKLILWLLCVLSVHFQYLMSFQVQLNSKQRKNRIEKSMRAR